MATIQNTITMKEQVSQAFSSIDRSGQEVIASFSKIESSLNGLTGKLDDAAASITIYKEGLTGIKRQFTSFEKNVRKLTNQFDRLNESVNSVGNSLTSTAKKARSAGASIRDTANQTVNTNNTFLSFGAGAKKTFNWLYRGFTFLHAAMYTTEVLARGLGKAINFADEYIANVGAINLLTNSLEETQEVQQKILGSAYRTRTAYNDVAKAAARIGILAGDAFKNNDEIIAFIELLNKSFKIGRAGAEEISSAMYQITQALASGRLAGDEFRTVSENAPIVVEKIAQYLGVAKGEVKALGADGKLTADVLKNSLLAAAEEINKEFETLPKTFADIGKEIATITTSNLAPALDKFSKLINSPQFELLEWRVIGVFAEMANALSRFMDVLLNLPVTFARITTTIRKLWDKFTTFWRSNWALIALATAPFVTSIVTTVIPAIAGAIASFALLHPKLTLIATTLGIVYFAATQTGMSFETLTKVVGVLTTAFATYKAIATTVKIINYSLAKSGAAVVAGFAPILGVISLLIILFLQISDVIGDFSIQFMELSNNFQTWVENMQLKWGEFMNTLTGSSKDANDTLGAKFMKWQDNLISNIGSGLKNVLNKMGFEDAANYMDTWVESEKKLTQTRINERNLVNKANTEGVDQLRKSIEYTQQIRQDEINYQKALAEAEKIRNDVDPNAVTADIQKQIDALKNKYGSDLNDTTDWEALMEEATSSVYVDGGHLDSVGVVDEIKLEMLRDLSRDRIIRTYVPINVEVNAQFGDVRETADADQLLARIADGLETAVNENLLIPRNVSAFGVG